MKSSGGPFSSVARNLGQLRNSPVSWSWFGLVIGIHFLVESRGGTDFVSSWYENLGLSREGFLSGKVWQVFSYGFLHGSWLHAGMNSLFVLLIGSRIEYVAGRAVMIRVMLAGVLGGAAGHLVLGSGLLVGLSGGCLALLLLLTTLSPQSKMFPLPVSGRSLGLGILLAELILALIDPALGLPGLSLLGRNLADHGMDSWFRMGHACHFGGGIAGWAFGRWMLRPRITLDRLRRDRARREAG
jgi:membrane associated rhomboid family serine protease